MEHQKCSRHRAGNLLHQLEVSTNFGRAECRRSDFVVFANPRDQINRVLMQTKRKRVTRKATWIVIMTLAGILERCA